VIDIDRMDEQLASALTGKASRAPRSPAPVPAPTPAPAPASRPATATELLELGMLEAADAAVRATAHPRDALTWATMRALLDGRRDAVRTGVEELRRLAQRTDDPVAWDRYWVQCFWYGFEWGTAEERLDVLDHCRERAYRFDDLPWWGNLTLLLAAMGKTDEATRAFDQAAVQVAQVPLLDAVTNLVDAGALLGDAGRVAAVAHGVHWPEGRLVVVGDGVVCKGSVDRYRALAIAAAGRWTQAGECFRAAESTHRAIGAEPLLARTLQQASGALVAA
jgi:hypothetical protein